MSVAGPISLSIASVRTAQFEAIKAGREDQQIRFDITPNDIDALQDSLRQNGITDGQLAYIMDGDEADAEGAGERCDAVQALLTGVSEQPEGRRALLVGALVVGT